MSLDWNIGQTAWFLATKDCETNPEHAEKRAQEWPQVNHVIWSTMATGIGEITDETLPEFAARLALWEKLHGFDAVPVTLLLQLRGLNTNVFPQESRTKWLKRIIGFELDQTARRAGKYVQETDAAQVPA